MLIGSCQKLQNHDLCVTKQLTVGKQLAILCILYQIPWPVRIAMKIYHGIIRTVNVLQRGAICLYCLCLLPNYLDNCTFVLHHCDVVWTPLSMPFLNI